MKRSLTVTFSIFTCFYSLAHNQDSVVHYLLPDSVRAISFMADITVSSITPNKELFVGIRTDPVKLSLESDRKEREVVFEFPSGSTVLADGIGTKKEKGELSWRYNWTANERYRLMIAMAGDSAGNFALYSGYIFLPREKKWKLLGTCSISGQWNTLKQPAVFHTPENNAMSIKIGEAWCQRSNGSWKNLQEKKLNLPVVNLFSHIDSLEQLQIDTRMIAKAIADSKTDARQSHAGIYYVMVKEGQGKQVSVSDTVTVFYRGSLLKDGAVFDETKEIPATFPLRRLIMGWQIGVPLCKIGGRIKIVIPSNLAYSIRTRAAKIPPNSILVFDIEVVDARSPI